MKKEAREKLKEKNIQWKQVYTDKTRYLKEQFEDVVGPGSYFRFEGEANDGDRYYCIIGPAKVHDPRAKFFAGVRKLPATYSAGGKYFDSMDAAASYALETWGVSTPRELKPYTSAQLYGISDKVKKWKAEREEKDNKDSKKESQMKFNLHLLKESMSQEADRITKEAMGATWQRNREDYTWWNLDDLGSNPESNPEFSQFLEGEPTLMAAFNEARVFHQKMTRYFSSKYALPPRAVGQIYKMFFGYHPIYGAYYTSIGPYKGPKEEGENRFSYFTKRMRKKDANYVQQSITNSLKKYVNNVANAYGLTEEDFDISDFQVKLTVPQEFDPNRTNQKNDVILETDNFSSPETQRQLQELGMGGLDESDEDGENWGIFADPTFSFNPKGQTKIIEKLAEAGNYTDLLSRAIHTVGNEINAGPDEVSRTMRSNRDTLQRVVKILNELYAELGDEAIALGIDPPPVNISKDPLLKIQGKSGAQIPTALSTSKEMIRKMEFQNEITQMMIDGITNPEEILNQITSRIRNKSKDSIPLTYIQNIVDGINSERFEENESGEKIEVKPLNQILVEQNERYEDLKNQHGFKSLQEAFKMAALYFSSKPVDDLTKHKITLEDENVVFDPPGDIIDIDSNGLRYLREHRGQLTDEQISQIVDDTEGMQSVEDILEDMGIDIEEDEDIIQDVEDIEEETEVDENPTFDGVEDDVDFEIEDMGVGIDVPPVTEDVPTTVQPKTPTQQKQPSKQTKPSKPKLDDEIQRILDEEDDDEFGFDHLLDAASSSRTIVSKTLSNLIDIADKMDNKGDYKNAEKVHLLIQKYMGNE